MYSFPDEQDTMTGKCYSTPRYTDENSDKGCVVLEELVPPKFLVACMIM